ncbi:transmembrane and coiled-coil domain-containing protein 4 isoform X2 [Parasteatoda tepidariorum]|uniref:transmembrane and coiled-coil domain-containing protein 4 isoform X2 n=1 Tax=Parasteatoda tepidariorum TaxID=114398 RepID=UPI00077FD30A|nr:transmembrane and coiled-coil domain-containing protein 4 isoform X2 [Parasteatoda tepidariorum]
MDNRHHGIFKPLHSIISDAGMYAYCATCAMSLYNLFKEEWNRNFREQCMTKHITHVGLPKQVESSLYAFLTGEGGDIEPLLNVLKKEPKLNGNCLRIIEDLILFAVEEGIYDARMRVLILHVAWLLRVALPLVEIYEESVVDMLSREVQEMSEDEKKANAKRQRNKKIKRYLLVGMATIGGGAVLGLTGGLAAPFMAAGAGAIIGGAGAAALGSAAGIAVIGSLFGVAGAGLTGYKMQKRVGDIEEFAFDTLTEGRQLHVTLAISGWLTEEDREAFQEPWLTLMHSREQYCLRYESNYLLQLGRAMDYLFSFAVSMAAQEALKYTILSGLIAAITWPAALVTVSGVIDNPWGVCLRRSAQVGRHLADVLLERQQGKRPITLIGFSLGARVIYYCLQEMSKRKGCEGIIEDAILLGAPVTADVEIWKDFSKVVSGRVVNGYCRGDWLLKFLYRTSSVTMKIAGLQPIKWDDRRMCNVDLSSVVSGHMDYSNKMDVILKAVGVRTIDEIVDDSKLRKSRSEIPTRHKIGEKRHKRMLHSKSCGDIHFQQSIPTVPDISMQRDRSCSLDSVLSRSSTSSMLLLNPTGLKTSTSRLSPVTFLHPKCKELNSSEENIQNTDLIVPSNWDWEEIK